MDIIVKLTTAGANIGPTFNLYSDVDNYVTPFVTNVSKTSLLSGYYTNLAPINTTIVRVKSMGVDCTNFVNVTVLPPTTTTTTTYNVTIDFTITLDYSIINNPRIITNNYTGSPYGLYEYIENWQVSKYNASDPGLYQTQDATEKTYYYQGSPDLPGFPVGTYWFGVRDANNSYNMKVKSVDVPLITFTQIDSFFNFPPITTLCTEPAGSLRSSFWCTTPTYQAGSKVCWGNSLAYPVQIGMAFMTWFPPGGSPGPIFVVIDNDGTLGPYSCSTTTTTTTTI